MLFLTFLNSIVPDDEQKHKLLRKTDNYEHGDSDSGDEATGMYRRGESVPLASVERSAEDECDSALRRVE
jgi:hypothetical protein